MHRRGKRLLVLSALRNSSTIFQLQEVDIALLGAKCGDCVAWHWAGRRKRSLRGGTRVEQENRVVGCCIPQSLTTVATCDTASKERSTACQNLGRRGWNLQKDRAPRQCRRFRGAGTTARRDGRSQVRPPGGKATCKRAANESEADENGQLQRHFSLALRRARPFRCR